MVSKSKFVSTRGCGKEEGIGLGFRLALKRIGFSSKEGVA